MTSLALRRHARPATTRTLLPTGGSGAALLLITDAFAAIAFAAGLAGAVARVAGGLEAVLPWLILALGGGVSRGLLGFAAAGIGAAEGRRATIFARLRVATAAFARRPGRAVETDELVSAMVDDAAALDGYAARFLPARRAAAAAPTIVAGAIAWVSPISAAILLATLVPFVAAMILAGAAAADHSRRQFEAMTRLSALFADRVRALPVILAFRAERGQAARIESAAEELGLRTMGVLRLAFLSTGALEFFAALSVALVAVYCGFSLLGLLPFRSPEHLDIGRAFFVLALAPEFYAPMRRLAAAYHDRQAADTAVERLAPLAVAPLERRAIVLTAPPAITFRSVAIRFPETDRDAVQGFSLALAPGEIVALVGPSGAGKSSLLLALLGIVPVAGGAILVNGAPLDETADLGPSVGWAGQSPLILPGALRDAIALGSPNAEEAAIVAAARAAGLGGLLDRRGLDVSLDERGSGLSGGERRRIGVARAILKDAPLLLLDEPTAHLDGAAERALIATLRRACAGRTTLVATHSTALAAIADRVVTIGADA